MTAPAGEILYKVWACDNQVYGPIDLPTLIQWTIDERILPETWILRVIDNAWRPAGYLSDLKPHFAKARAAAKAPDGTRAAGQVQPDELRQFNLFTAVSNEQIAQFIEFADFLSCQPNQVLIHKGDPGDAIFFLLSGLVRARLMVGGEDKELSHIRAGEFFGEMAMLTQSARSADVVVVESSRLLRVSVQSFRRLSEEQPALAVPILAAMCRTLAQRMANLTLQHARERTVEYAWR